MIRALAFYILIIFNFIIGFTVIPFVTVLAIFIDIEGGGPELYYQTLYFIPAFLVLCTAASVALRRKGFSKGAFIMQFVGPAVWGLLLLVNTIGLF